MSQGTAGGPAVNRHPGSGSRFPAARFPAGGSPADAAGAPAGRCWPAAGAVLSNGWAGTRQYSARRPPVCNGLRLAGRARPRYDRPSCQRAAWADVHTLRSGEPATASAAGTEEAMSEANISTEQSQAGQAARLSPPDVDAGRTNHPEGSPPEGSAPPVGLIWRVDRRNTFASLRRARRHRGGPLTVSWVGGSPVEPPRVAYTIGRRVGSAVVRNRVRRRLRALVREAARCSARGPT